MRVLDLFSGIGGFSLGLERAGMETIAFCEIDPYCRRVLKKHWPDVPIYEDVRELRGDEFGDVDLICGGYPCQGESLAGERRGASDDRWLWPEYRRLVETLRPAWVIGENVAGHVTMGLDTVLSDLVSLGYACQTFVIPACAVDAPHRRDRVWVVGYSEGQRWRSGEREKFNYGRESLNASPDVSNAGSEQHESNSDALEGQEPQIVFSNALRGGSQRPRRSRHAGNYTANGNRQEHRAFHDCKWPPEPGICRVAYGIPKQLDGDLDAEKFNTEGSPTPISHSDTLRELRRRRGVGEASPGLFGPCEGRGSVPAMPSGGRHSRWPSENEVDARLRSMRDTIPAEPQQEAHSLQQSLLSGEGAHQRNEALAPCWTEERCDVPRIAYGIPNRTDRLRGLGNAVVPQVVEIIGRAIMEAAAA